jgi:hypothetical protein
MKRQEWLRSILLIIGLLAASILVAQSRRNCEIPGSSWVPCIWGEPLHGKPKTVRHRGDAP